MSGRTIYTYVGGNPVSYIDPEGLQVAQAFGGLFSLAAMAAAASNPDSSNAISKAVQKVKEWCEPKKDDEKCGPDSRITAQMKAYAFAEVPLDGASCDSVPWSDYNNKNSRGYAQARSQGAKCMGYRSQSSRARVEEHPGGHNDTNAPHHDCPHFHATNAAGQSAIFTYKL